MTSPHDEQALLLYAHGELSGLERARMELHLRSCPACRLRWQQYRTDAGVIRHALQAHLPRASASRLAAAISERVRETAQEQYAPPASARGYRSRGLVLVTVALALLLLLAATAAVLRRGAASKNPADCDKPPAAQTTPSATDILPSGGSANTPGR